MRCHRPAHWGAWRFSSCVEVAFLVTDLAALTRQLSLWNKISIFSSSIFLSGSSSHCWGRTAKILYLSLGPNVLSSFYKEIRGLGASACLFLGVPYFQFSLRFSNPSKSIFSIIYVWHCFHLLVSSSNSKFISKLQIFKALWAPLAWLGLLWLGSQQNCAQSFSYLDQLNQTVWEI